ncbi:glycosyltransferase family 1 protein [Methylobacterium sp. 13MFTsu3.1M2]|uniref:glycosyltransferase family 4 protein n=1 Tax=Methylobacterium sp. 13MFTsu3.1M2 TaxID=1502776 RepID=UPI000B8A0553|nr:glycosyltransferase family 1 protein [Methylobacterium sp. 13MFTsu3.1M2]
MMIAIDGGAFQQGLAAGIYNVAVGLMNAVAARNPAIEFVLVIDPSFGDVREELVARLSVKPRIFSARLVPAKTECVRHLTTTEPNLIFYVDGKYVPAEFIENKVTYIGKAPRDSFRLLSRKDSPAVTEGTADTRELGVLISHITIRADDQFIPVELNDHRLTTGFHGVEWGCRWTNGAAELPLEIFPVVESDVKIEITIAAVTRYRIGSSLFDARLQQLSKRMDDLSLQVSTDRAEYELIQMGAKAFITNHFIPVRFSALPQYSILYDMIPIIFPDFFYSDARENFANNILAFKNSVHVFSISETSKIDLARLAGISSDKITAMMIDIDPIFSRRSDEEINEVLKRHRLENKSYIISVGTLEPRKNHGKLIEAYEILLRNGAPSCDLVLVGKNGWGTSDLSDKINALGLEDRVHILQGVSNDELSALYSGALYSVYPSLYEGFGLPVIEAMACGCPVITSNRSSMSEIAGQAALLVDPTSRESLAVGLSELLMHPSKRQHLTRLGYMQRRNFSWDITAQRVLDVLELG